MSDRRERMLRLVEIYRDTARVRCTSCGALSVPVASTCPRSITCPVCGAGPNVGCRRPSGHNAAKIHQERVDRAEDMDLELMG